ISEGRVRYHADRITVRVSIDEALRAKVRSSVARARALRAELARPPVTENERRCRACSLAQPACRKEAVSQQIRRFVQSACCPYTRRVRRSTSSLQARVWAGVANGS